MSESTRTEKKKKWSYGNNKNKPRKPTGAVAALKSNVYILGNGHHGNQYINTNVAIEDYAVREYGKLMGQLFHEKDIPPAKPDKPTAPKGKTLDDLDIKVYEQQIKQWLTDTKEYTDNKSKVFRLIIGQCMPSMRRKLESMPGYESLKEDDDVVGLLREVKNLTFTTTSAKYEYWTLQDNIRSLAMCKQGDQEEVTAFYKRWRMKLDVVESQYGPFGPEKLSSGADKDTERKKFQACLFVGSLCTKRYGKWVNELNNSFLSNQNNYPESVEDALLKAQERMDDDGKVHNTTLKSNTIKIRTTMAKKMRRPLLATSAPPLRKLSASLTANPRTLEPRGRHHAAVKAPPLGVATAVSIPIAAWRGTVARIPNRPI